jgi:hypothetical protein
LDPPDPLVGPTVPGVALDSSKGLPGVEKGGGEVRLGFRLTPGLETLVQDSQHSRW